MPVPQREPLIASIRFGEPSACDVCLSDAEHEYALAVSLEEDGCRDCVDHFYQAILLTWPYVEEHCQGIECGAAYRAGEIYRASSSKLLTTAQRFGRLDLPHGLWVHTDLGKQWIDIELHGFVWPTDAFNCLIPVGDYEAEEANCVYRCEGIGVPFIVQRKRCHDEFLYRRSQSFSATALVRPSLSEASEFGQLVVELYDPLRVNHVEVGGLSCKLSHDLTAPFEYAAHTRPNEGITGFLQPGSTQNDAGLFMLEPYQPGKVPVIFVHGLLSEPTTWIAMANELRANPDLQDRIQLWGFEYPTGQAFVRSAADLRAQLLKAQRVLDPNQQDPALQEIVLIGHSMGGLISKLQVTESGDILWNSVAGKPLPEIVAINETRQQLARSFFFAPVSQVKRVIYIGTPHQGSSFAQRSIGRIGALLVEEPEDVVQRHQQLIDANPGVFSEEMKRRVPTSVDLMQPSSDLLQAMDRLPRNPEVAFHSIIGTGRRMLLDGPADGVVPVSSAKQQGVETEQFVDETHTDLHRSPQAIAEVICILRWHLNQ